MVDPVKIHFHLTQDEDGYPPAVVESLWAKPGAKPNEYVIDNVPFYARDATIGDTVLVREEDGQRWFKTLVHRSQNSLVRVVFFDRASTEKIDTHLQEMGCSTEFFKDHNLLAVSIPGNVKLADVQAYLQEETNAGSVDFEEPILRQSSSHSSPVQKHH